MQRPWSKNSWVLAGLRKCGCEREAWRQGGKEKAGERGEARSCRCFQAGGIKNHVVLMSPESCFPCILSAEQTKPGTQQRLTK